MANADLSGLAITLPTGRANARPDDRLREAIRVRCVTDKLDRFVARSPQ